MHTFCNFFIKNMDEFRKKTAFKCRILKIVNIDYKF